MTIHELVKETADLRRDIESANIEFKNRDIAVSAYAARIARLTQRYQANLELLAFNKRDEYGRKV